MHRPIASSLTVRYGFRFANPSPPSQTYTFSEALALAMPKAIDHRAIRTLPILNGDRRFCRAIAVVLLGKGDRAMAAEGDSALQTFHDRVGGREER